MEAQSGRSYRLLDNSRPSIHAARYTATAMFLQGATANTFLVSAELEFFAQSLFEGIVSNNARASKYPPLRRTSLRCLNSKFIDKEASPGEAEVWALLRRVLPDYSPRQLQIGAARDQCLRRDMVLEPIILVKNTRTVS